MRRIVIVAGIVSLAAGVYAGVTVTPVPDTRPTSRPGTTSAPATTKASIPQDGPGMYRISAGPNLEFTATVRAKSREDALNIALKTVARRAMDYDENVNINKIKIERIGP